MKKNPWMTLLILVFIFGTLSVFMIGVSAISLFGDSPVRVTAKNSILHLELEGVILDGKKFLKSLIKYSKDKNIKAVVISINSPGGVVGPSQEIYQEILNVKEELDKPVVIHSVGLMASGGYYAAVAGDKIIVEPGTLMGSIGVIMQFTNMEKLYDWAKIKRFSITTGRFKDSGAEYRPMRDDEKALFQEMMNDVWVQFKEAVAKGRKLEMAYVNKYADGRVFTGKMAKELGFADEIGTLQDAYEEAANLADIDVYEIFEPPKRKGSIVDFFMQDEDEASSKIEKGLSSFTEKFLKTELMNRPLFLMPGSL